jgi:hypothetical protein
MRRPEIGSPEWLRAIPARWGLTQEDACRVMGIAPSTFQAKCRGARVITERLIGRIVDVELCLAKEVPPFGWPFSVRMPEPNQLILSDRTIDHLQNIIAAQNALRGQEISGTATV